MSLGRLGAAEVRRRSRLLTSGKSRGIALLETVVALGVLGLVGVAFMSAMTTSFRATDINDDRVTGENLLRTQLEYIRGQSYFTPPGPLPYTVQAGDSYKLPSSVSLPAGFTLATEIDVFNDGTGALNIAQVQKITAKVYRDGKVVSNMADIKTNR